jgi:hypothetical protein
MPQHLERERENKKKKPWRDSLPIDVLLSAVCLGCCTAEFRSSTGTCELPCTFFSIFSVLDIYYSFITSF